MKKKFHTPGQAYAADLHDSFYSNMAFMIDSITLQQAEKHYKAAKKDLRNRRRELEDCYTLLLEALQSGEGLENPVADWWNLKDAFE